MNRCRLILLAILAAGWPGCASTLNHQQRLLVNFPAVKLDKDELIEDVEINIAYGYVAGVNRSIEDWDYAVSWDNPTEQNVRLSSRHFLNGCGDLRCFDGFITVTTDPTNRPFFKVETVLKIGKLQVIPPANTAIAGDILREIHVPPDQIILKPAPRR